MPILSFKNTFVTYKMKNKSVHAVNNVSFDVEKQDSVGIVGESGSGKSTLAMAALRLLPPNTAQVDGHVLFEGKDLLSLSDEKLRDMRWKEISVVFQKSMNSLSPVHKIGSQMADIYRIHNAKSDKSQAKKRVLELLEMVNLPQRIYTMYQHELSGGMMQRVSIAMSMMHNPKLIIMDEATTALDVVTQGQILEEIKELENKLHLTRIMITHDMSVVADTCRKIAVMYAGCLLEFGMVSEVISCPGHPYTRGLLKSFPTLKGERGDLRGIAGSLPDLSEKPEGCVFAARCGEATDKCHKSVPHMAEVSPGHRVMCHLAGGAQ